MSALVIESGPYAGYRVEVGEDHSASVYYSEAAAVDCLIRVHYRVSRTPSQKLFKVRHLSGSTPQDRENATRRLDRTGLAFSSWERQGAVARTRLNVDPTKWLFVAFAGTMVTDPLVQLELEMMIDLDSSIEVDR